MILRFAQPGLDLSRVGLLRGTTAVAYGEDGLPKLMDHKFIRALRRLDNGVNAFDLMQPVQLHNCAVCPVCPFLSTSLRLDFEPVALLQASVRERKGGVMLYCWAWSVNCLWKLYKFKLIFFPYLFVLQAHSENAAIQVPSRV